MADEIRWLVWFVLAVAAVYVLVRVGSFAYFRTKLDHFRRVLREIKRED